MKSILTGILSLFIFFGTAPSVNAMDMNMAGMEEVKKKKKKAGKKLSEKLADGTVDTLEREWELKRAKAEAHNKEVRAEMDKITKECQDKHGKDLVPANYPEPYNTQWQKAYSKEDWGASYPFSKENIEDFAKFCMQSGGFEIC